MNNHRYIIHKLTVLALASTFLFSTNADFAFSGSSSNTLSISTQKSENNKFYILEIFIDGMKPSNVKVNIRNHKMFIVAQNGGVISNNAISGGQFVNYSYPFPRNADLKNLIRIDTNKLITITISKIKE